MSVPGRRSADQVHKGKEKPHRPCAVPWVFFSFAVLTVCICADHVQLIQVKHPSVTKDLINQHWLCRHGKVPRALRRGFAHIMSVNVLDGYEVHFDPHPENTDGRYVATRMKLRASMKDATYFVTIIYTVEDRLVMLC